jgi:PAS domain S-box-containing protein
MALDAPRVRSRLDILYLVTREFHAALNIDQVLYNVLSATVASVGASDAGLFLFDPAGRLENSLVVSKFEIQPQGEADLEALTEKGLAGWVKKYRKGILIQDTATDERWYANPAAPELLDVSSAVGVPIQLADRLIGILMITAAEANYFDESDLAMLTIIADQAAFALANARLFEAEQHRWRVANTLSATAHTINSTLNLPRVLALILEQLQLVVDCDSSSIMLYDEEQGILAVQAARGFDDMADALRLKIPFNENSPNYRAILQKQPIVIADVKTEPHWVKTTSSEHIRSWIGTPLIARDKVVGLLTVDSREPDKYTEEIVEIVAAFADQAATAVANAQIVAQLKNTEASYATLFEDNADVILITNYDGLILAANRKACQTLRRHKDAVINSNLRFIDPLMSQYLARQTPRLKRWREASIELDIKDAYRQAVPLEFKIRQIQFGGRDCVEWVGRDISMRREIERMREDLVNMLVHDLRGPLSNMTGTIELITMLIGRNAAPSQIEHLLEIARRSSQALKDLVDSILDVSRLEQGELPLQRTMTRLDQLLQTVQEQILLQAQAKKMTLTIHPVPETAEAWLDTNLIRRVLVNLAGNAIKYTQSEGWVALETTLSDKKLHFAISDNGPGISEADQARIFDKFARVNHSASFPSGVGLGLAFCKLAVEAHGGAISIESKGILGQGSTFHVSLPLITEPIL